MCPACIYRNGIGTATPTAAVLPPARWSASCAVYHGVLCGLMAPLAGWCLPGAAGGICSAGFYSHLCFACRVYVTDVPAATAQHPLASASPAGGRKAAPLYACSSSHGVRPPFYLLCRRCRVERQRLPARVHGRAAVVASLSLRVLLFRPAVLSSLHNVGAAVAPTAARSANPLFETKRIIILPRGTYQIARFGCNTVGRRMSL